MSQHAHSAASPQSSWAASARGLMTAAAFMCFYLIILPYLSHILTIPHSALPASYQLRLGPLPTRDVEGSGLQDGGGAMSKRTASSTRWVSGTPTVPLPLGGTNTRQVVHTSSPPHPSLRSSFLHVHNSLSSRPARSWRRGWPSSSPPLLPPWPAPRSNGLLTQQR